MGKPAQAQSEHLFLMYADLEPYVVINDNNVSGFLADYLAETGAAAGVELVWKFVHWDRQLPLLRDNQSNICGVGLYKTEQRLNFLRFSDPIGIDQGLVLVGIKNHPGLSNHADFKSIYEDPALIPVLQMHSVYSEYVNKLLKTKLRPVTRGSLERIVRMLRAGSHDYMILTPHSAATMKDRFGLSIYSHYPDLADELPYYLGCSLSTDSNILARLNSEIKKRGPVKN